MTLIISRILRNMRNEIILSTSYLATTIIQLTRFYYRPIKRKRDGTYDKMRTIGLMTSPTISVIVMKILSLQLQP